MPELPEIETIRSGLQNLVGRKVKKIFRSDKKLRIASSLDLQGLNGLEILEINRRARYLILNFSKEKSLILHLGMSGKVTLQQKFQQLKHDHFVIFFDDDSHLIFNDARRFGFIDLVATKDLENHQFLKKLGVEPLANDFDFLHLQKKLQRKKMNIKTAMMNNEIVVGVGNIYINESLFDSGISPLREASSLTENELKKLISSIKKILKNAIKLGGSSISDYVNSNGDYGNFQNTFRVYGRAKEKCLQCKNLVKKIVQNGRSSFYCDSCQK
jgi:formamidopyrimidine-DNA glycosylase